MKQLIIALTYFTLSTHVFVAQTDGHFDEKEIIAKKLKSVVLDFNKDSIRGFNDKAAWQQAEMSSAPQWEQQIFVAHLKRNYIDTKYGLNNQKTSGGGPPTVQAACTNVDFEAGNASGWTITEGLNANSITRAGCCPTASTRFSVVAPGFDPSIPALATVPPGGGNFSLKLGDGSTTTGHAVRARQTFNVTAANSIFVYKYAVALEDAGHACVDQPYFNIAFTDCLNNPIPCSDFNVVPTSASCAGGSAGFSTTGFFKWQNWSTRSFDLTAYIGQCVTIEFTASDCVQTAHAGWAYIDCSCQPMTLSLNGTDIPVGQVNNSLCSLTSNTLCAPPGFTSYTWTGPGVTGLTGQCVNATSIGSYSVTLGMAGVSCSSPVLHSTFSLTPAPIADFNYTATPCQNNLTVPFTAVVNLNGGPAITSYSWDFNGDGITDNTTINPTYTYTAFGTYNAQLLISNGSCTSNMVKVITIQPTPTVNVANVSAVCSGSCVVLSGTAIEATSSTITTTPSFNASPNAAISAVGTSTTLSTINVTGLSTATLSSICLNINHTYDADLKIYLICPSGTTLTLSSSNGGALDNYVNTCFNSTSATNITAGTPPFSLASGYIPQGGQLSTLNSCLMNGTWTLKVVDGASGDGGTFLNWSLVFNNVAITTGTANVSSFAWSPAVTSGSATFSPTVCPTSTTVYSLTANGSNGCVATNTVLVKINPNPSITLVPTNPTCGLSNGIVVINNTSAPASGPYVFATSVGALGGQTITAVPAGAITVSITNVYGCAATSNTTLINQPGPTAITSPTTSATCGLSNGSFTISSTTGGTPAYTYSLNGAAIATTTVSGLAAGTYTLLVKDFNGCIFTKSVVIINTPGPTAITGTTTLTGCTINNGTYDVTSVTGGTSAYSFSVDAVATGSLTSGLAAGTHTILVKDFNGCTFSTTFVINTANGPTAAVVSTSNASCGNANGSATVTSVTAGTPTYSYSFGGAFATGTSTTGLTAGSHTVTVKDANGCTFTQTFVVGNNPPPTVAVTTSLNILCNGASTGSLTVAPTGGTAPFTYTLTAPSVTNTTGSFTGLAAGVYTATVRDNAGCTATVTATLTQPTVVTGTTSSIPVVCFGTATGTVSAGGAGGVAPYTYLWPGLGNSTLATVGGAVAGTYTVTIKDANLCTITKTIVVTQPTSLTVTSTLTPATCGNANGSGTVTVAGGSPGYTYNWSNGGLTNVLSAATAGNYTVTIQDLNGCILTNTVTITNIPGPTAITGTTTLTGCTINNGTYNVTGVTGGTAAYSFSVDAVATGSLTSGLAAGTHTITVKDVNGCIFSTTFVINTANGPTSATIVTTNASCGTANGTATVTGVTGGTAAYQYSFDGGAFGASTVTSGLASGNHTVTVKDVNGCTLLVTYIELNNAGPTASVTNSININCFGGSTGSFTVTPVGGIAPFTYTLTAPVQTNGTGVFTGLPAGVYNVTVRDNSGCTATASVTLTQPTAVTLTVTALPASCFGSATGTVSASGGGGVGPYTYLWPTLGSSTLAIVNNVLAGTYSVTQTDSKGCTITQGITVTQPTSLTLTSTLTPATCGNANGSGTVTVAGGSPAYAYSWSNGGISNTLSGAIAGTYTIVVTDFKGCVLTKTVTVTNIPGPTAIAGATTLAGCGLLNGTYNVTSVTGGTPAYNFAVDAVATGSLTSGLGAGTHTVLVTDFNGCTFTTTFNIGTTPSPTAAIVLTTNATCGTANGTSTVTSVSGGSAAFQYSFDGGGFAVGASTTGLLAGTHTVTIKDANSCSLTVTYNVLNNGSPTASILSTTAVSCFGGSNGGFTALGTGGSGAPFTYTLSSPFSSNGTGVFTGLVAGIYNVITKDAAGCTATTSLTITQPPAVTITPTSLPVKCFGTATGTINVVGSGGTGAYTYNLNGGAYQASTVFANQFAGTYIMGIKDVNGCTATQTVTVTQPTALAVTVASQNANCTAANGIITTTVSGGSPIYTYSWTGGGGAAATSNSLVAGNYTVTATDANGCIITSPAVIGLTPGGTAAITASTNVTCNGLCNGSLTSGMIGGASPFTYSWSPGGQTTQVATGLCPATYTCVITDFYGCKANAIGTITQPTALTSIMNSNNVKCFGTATGTVSAAGSGGTGPYTYLWSTIPSTLATTANVAIGTYSCNITDANNCTITSTIGVTQPSSVTLTSTFTSANCNQANGSATVTAAGGTPAYTYSWSSGSSLATISNAFAGTYTIVVKDANNCSQTLATTIPNLAGPSISILTQTNVACFGGNTGAATATVTGGVTPYIYQWSNFQNTPTATNLTTGLYTVSVTDNAGCVASTSVSISQPLNLTLTILSTNPKCFGATNGFGVSAANGGTAPYSYTWTAGGGNSATSNLLGAGNYGETVMDSHGCVTTATMALVNPPAMVASTTFTNVTCFGMCNGIAAATSTNGIAPVNYNWVGGASPISAQVATGLCSGTYTMTATDFNNCTATSIVSINQPSQLTVTIPLSGSVTCNGGNDGFASATPAGGTAGYTYAWSSGGNAANTSSLVAGNYSITVTDTKSCTATANVTILQPTPFATTLTTTNPKCFGICDGTGGISFAGGTGTTTFLWQPGLQSGNSVNNLCVGGQTVTITSNGACPTILTFTLTQPTALTAAVTATNSHCTQADGLTNATVGGGTSPLSYLWSNGVTTLSNNNVLAGAYTFTVTDANLCKTTASGLVNDIAGPVVSILSQTNVSCFGGNNGAATSTITGGVTPYNIAWSGNAANTQNVFNFTSGLENITVTDAAGCVGTASVMINQPTALTSAIGSFSNVTCNGLNNGQATMLVNGGTTPYVYAWTPSAQTSSVMINVGANTYTCNVTDNNLCTTSQVVTISEPLPLLMTNSVVTNVACFGGANGQIATTVQGGTPVYNYTWTPAQSNSGVVGGLAQGPYSVVIKDIKNCSISANFNILEPSALTSTSLSLPAKCGIANGSATVTASGGTATYNLTWNTSTPQSGTVAVNMASANYICTITDAHGCTLTQPVNVPNAPSPIITSTIVTQPLCFGQQNGSIAVNYTSGTPNYQVSWSSPISQTVTTSALSETVSGVGAGNYVVTITDSYGCTTSAPVIVAAPPFLSLTSSVPQTICFGQTAQIYATAGGGTGPYTYTWTPASVGTGAGPLTVSPTVNTVYQVAMSDANGCSPSPNVITVNVTPPLAISGFSVTKCENDGVSLSPTITSPGNGGGPTGYNYSWSNGATTSSIIVTAILPTPNQYIVTIGDGCTIPGASAVFTVNVNPLPNGTFAANSTTACVPSSLTFSVTSNNPNSDTYDWYIDKNLSGNTNPFTYNFVNADTFSVDVLIKSALGCSLKVNRDNYIIIYPKPIAAFHALPTTASILDPTIGFVNTSQDAVSYIWDFGDQAATNGTNGSILQNPNHTFGLTGTYNISLFVTSIHGCTDLVSHPIEITPDFVIYIPNCFTPDGNGKNDIFQPMGVGIDIGNYRMDIFDRWGEQIFTSSYFNQGWNGSVKGSTKPAPQGVYTYKLLVYDLQGTQHPFVGHVTVLREHE